MKPRIPKDDGYTDAEVADDLAFLLNEGYIEERWVKGVPVFFPTEKGKRELDPMLKGREDK